MRPVATDEVTRLLRQSTTRHISGPSLTDWREVCYADLLLSCRIMNVLEIDPDKKEEMHAWSTENLSGPFHFSYEQIWISRCNWLEEYHFMFFEKENDAIFTKLRWC